jgi:MFS family permease
MGLGTLAIAATPGYATLGLAAPLLVLGGRLVQGLSAGVEVGGVSVYLSEIAPAGRRGFYVAWQSGSQQLAVITAALIGVVATLLLGEGAMNAWGWRIPFILGCLLVPFLLFVRSTLTETPAFLAQASRPSLGEIYRRAARHSGLIGLGALMAVMTTVFFYMITAYTPTYGSKVLHLGAQQSLMVTLCVGLLNFILLPVMGALSDRVGRRPLLIGAALVALVSGYPAMSWLIGAPSFGRLLCVELYFAVVYATYNGAMVVFLTEVMPPSLRTSAFSLAYSLATALFGGFTPALSTWLIHRTGDKAIPGAWLSAASLVSLAAVLLLSRASRGVAPPGDSPLEQP